MSHILKKGFLEIFWENVFRRIFWNNKENTGEYRIRNFIDCTIQVILSVVNKYCRNRSVGNVARITNHKLMRTFMGNSLR